MRTQPSIILSYYGVLCTYTTIGYNADVHTIQTILENFSIFEKLKIGFIKIVIDIIYRGLTNHGDGRNKLQNPTVSMVLI